MTTHEHDFNETHENGATFVDTLLRLPKGTGKKVKKIFIAVSVVMLVFFIAFLSVFGIVLSKVNTIFESNNPANLVENFYANNPDFTGTQDAENVREAYDDYVSQKKEDWAAEQQALSDDFWANSPILEAHADVEDDTVDTTAEDTTMSAEEIQAEIDRLQSMLEE